MIVGDALVFVHVPRWGGSSVEAWMRQAGLGLLDPDPNPMGVSGHAGVADIPPAMTRRAFVFSTVRDPASTYRSWFRHWVASRGGLGAVLQGLVGRPVVHDFKTLLAACLPAQSGYRHPSLERPWCLPSGRVLGSPGQLVRSGLGAASFCYLRLTLSDPRQLATQTAADFVAHHEAWTGLRGAVDMAQLQVGLAGMLESLQIPMPRLSVPHVTGRSSGGGLPVLQMDEEMVQWVAAGDQLLLSRFGYPITDGRVASASQPVFFFGLGDAQRIWGGGIELDEPSAILIDEPSAIEI